MSLSIIISAGVLVASIIGLVYIGVRYWPQLQSLDIESMPETRDAQTKNIILEERLKRKLWLVFESFWKYLRPVFAKIKNLIRNWYHTLLEKERHLREASEKIIFQEKAQHEQQEVIKDKLEEVEKNGIDETDTEQKYLEILSLDPKNNEAYEGLAELYYKQRDFLHAREVYEYIIKTTEEKIDYLIGIANCWHEEEDYKQAFKILEKALRKEPKSPKIIDMLVETAIIMKDQVMAKNYLKQLKEVNPENQKIHEFKAQINRI